ncbi:MAG: universal stress protein [Candidatus Schekmanbacteria bacterium]|nr:universal stress protein [Candidatus Schekmanbacteria bacterium]
MRIRDVIIPVDFSAGSVRAIEFAVSLMPDGGEIDLLHVIDEHFIDRIAAVGLGTLSHVTEVLRNRAEEQLPKLAATFARDDLEINTMVVVGKPFVEIIRLAHELDFQMIVMGTHGRHIETIEQALFGTTVERVLRATRRPVLCVPYFESTETPEV